MEHQTEFLNDLRKKIKNESNIRECLWSSSYSHTILKISFINKDIVNQKQILEIVTDQMESATFDWLVTMKFKNEITTNYVNNELWITWERERDRDHPHGKVNIFMSAGPISYGTDEAGSVWWSPSVGVWKLHKYKE